MRYIFEFILMLIIISYFTLRESASPHAYLFNLFLVFVAAGLTYWQFKRRQKKKIEKLARKRQYKR